MLAKHVTKRLEAEFRKDLRFGKQQSEGPPGIESYLPLPPRNKPQTQGHRGLQSTEKTVPRPRYGPFVVAV